MSRLVLANGDDYPEAANKHLSDAGALLASGHPDGAAYLSGYVVECSLKALIQLETGAAPHDHDFASLGRRLHAAMAAAGARTARYFGRATQGLPSAAISQWVPAIRYRGSTMATADAQAWHHDAREIHRETVHQMRLDGVI